MTVDAPERLALRPYQEDVLARVAEAEARGVRRQLVVMATGLGKTVVFCALAERRGGRTLILAHRDELVLQAAAKILEMWPGLGASASVLEQLRGSDDVRLRSLGLRTALDARGVGIVKGPAKDTRARVVVASVQTLSRPERLSALIAPTLDTGWLAAEEGFGLVVVDEAHHATAPSYRAVLDGLSAGAGGACSTCPAVYPEPEFEADCADVGCTGPKPAGPLLVGVTATPDRGDGKGLDAVFGEVVSCHDILWGIRAGFLADLRGRRIKLAKLDLSTVKVSKGDYDQGQAGAALEDAGAPQHIVRAWRAEADGRRTIVFAPTVEMAKHVAEAFEADGVRAGYVHGGTPLEDRRRLLAEFGRGELQVMSNCGVLTEGYDNPAVDCVVVARPTRSRGLYAQMVGRGTRRFPGKDHLLVLDVVGATDQHSLVTVPSLFGVENPKQWERSSESLSERLAKQDAEAVRLGLMRAEDAELFGKVRASNVAWVQAHADGAELRRYVRPLGREKDGTPRPTVVLAQRVAGEDVWTAGLWFEATGEKRVLLADSAMETAQGVAEDYVRLHGAALASLDAPWRKRNPKPTAVAAAEKWHLPNARKFKTAGELSDALDAHVARIKARPKGAR